PHTDPVDGLIAVEDGNESTPILATRDFIKVQQKKPYGNIMILRGKEMCRQRAPKFMQFHSKFHVKSSTSKVNLALVVAIETQIGTPNEIDAITVFFCIFLLKRYSTIILDEAHERSLNRHMCIRMLSCIMKQTSVLNYCKYNDTSTNVINLEKRRVGAFTDNGEESNPSKKFKIESDPLPLFTLEALKDNMDVSTIMKGSGRNNVSIPKIASCLRMKTKAAI
ncbi:ATP-dependent RNA helicase DEAH13-like protein, partial [Tanacetum coccineum]